MKNNQLNKLIKEILLLINNNDFINAEINTKKYLKKIPNSHILNDLMGSIFINKKMFSESIEYYKKALSIDPNFVASILNMGVAFQKLGKDKEAIFNFNTALKKNSKLFTAYNNIGFILNRQGKYREAVVNLKKAIKINPNFAESYLNLGISFQNLEKNDEAINTYKKALTLKENFYDVYFNLGEIYKKIDKPKEALEHFLKSKNRKTNEKLLECLFLLNLQKEYTKLIKTLDTKDPNNRGIASISAYISNQFNIPNSYNYCPQPLDFIFKTNLNQSINNFDKYLNDLLNEISKQNFAWEPYARTANKGFVTKGNLSELKLPQLTLLEKYISEQIKNYRIFYKNKKCGYINKWPKKYNYMIWSNRLKKEGYNKSHIHPSGWLSGVFYLKIPSKIKNNEAGIEFNLHGSNFKIKNNNIPKKNITPEVGDLIMFPSSLFHKTIPFESNEERICIAFDIIKIN